MGDETLSELAPTCGKESSETQPFRTIQELLQSSGIKVKPVNLSNFTGSQDAGKAPWQRAQEVASFCGRRLATKKIRSKPSKFVICWVSRNLNMITGNLQSGNRSHLQCPARAIGFAIIQEKVIRLPKDLNLRG
ncbi:hypothetical protein [[Phormidium] sp. ETS-05]|uniref:hypothetical protein n=1 Tax=[Phormidium] sp. ETS-05 TaxID=222819 RepID=UPI0018EEE0B8|nr:hypothetical protein [[Phormidium] sp. ETS-05]